MTVAAAGAETAKVVAAVVVAAAAVLTTVVVTTAAFTVTTPAAAVVTGNSTAVTGIVAAGMPPFLAVCLRAGRAIRSEGLGAGGSFGGLIINRNSLFIQINKLKREK